jgi:hypothetical protein
MSDERRPERRTRLLIGLLLLVVFLSGAVLGAGILHFSRGRRGRAQDRLGPPLSEIGLSGEQELRARKVLDGYRPQIEAVLKDALPKIQVINEEVEAQVREFLTPDQVRHLEEIKQRKRPPPLPETPAAPSTEGSAPGRP